MRVSRVFRMLALLAALLAVTVAPAAAAPASQASCTTRATYVSETIPDNTVIAPGTAFTKTWRIRNDGTCTWGPKQEVDSLEMVAGSVMGSPTRVPLTETVRRGQTADISVKLQAPDQEGTYRSDWKFRRSNGLLFGLGATGATPFYVQVVVKPGTPTPSPQGERISFPLGATVASVQGRVSNAGLRSYLVAARKGQPMRVALVSANPSANFSVVGVQDGQPYKRVEVGEPWFYLVLPSTQDYRIDVRVASGAGTATYILSVAIAP